MLRLSFAAAAVVLAAAPAQAAHAATSCVGSQAGCFATIQAAVAAASSGDVVRVGPGVFTGGLTITKSITLVGAGAAATIIRGGGPVVTIGSPASAPTVSISGVTIRDGVATGNPHAPACGPDVPTCGPGYAGVTAIGGGVETFAGSTVTIAHSVITANRAVEAGSVPSVKAVCPLGPCPASFGDAAGIDDWGTMTLVDTTVSDNIAGGAQSNGGGIVAESGASLTVLGSTIQGNSANAISPNGRFASGGGVYVAGGATLDLRGSVVRGNAVTLTTRIPAPYPRQGGGDNQSNALGGGILVSGGGTAHIVGTTFSGNETTVDAPLNEPFGGDAAICACSDDAVLDVSDSAFVGNRTVVSVLSTADTGASGPAALEADGPATIVRTRIVGNSTEVTSTTGDAAAWGAAGFFSDGPQATLVRSVVSANTATATSATGSASVQGAGMVVNGPLTLSGVLVAANRGVAHGASGFAQGGGIFNGVFGGPTSLELVDTLVVGNALTGSSGLALQGGGIYTVGFPLSLERSVVLGNTPDNCAGC